MNCCFLGSGALVSISANNIAYANADLFCSLLESYLKFKTPLTTVALFTVCGLGANLAVIVNSR